MTTRVSPALLRFAAAANAIASPMPDHHRHAIAARSLGRDIISVGERWFLDNVLRLQALSGRQWKRLREIEGRIEQERRR
jgi:hypothetical protein